MLRTALCTLLAGLVACSSTPRRGPVVDGAVPPRSGVASDQREGDVREVVLTNGLRVLLKENHAAPVATLAVYYKVGSRNEHVGITGSSHLLEHLLFKGSRKYPGKAEIWTRLSRLGASFNATTYYDRTNYYATVPVEHLPFVIELEADRMRHALFTDEDRSKEMTVVRNELERGENSPGRVLHQAVWATAIQAHPYHHPVIGWRSDVENMPTTALRAHYDTFYHPDNAVVSVVGAFDSDEVLDLIVRHFGEYPARGDFPKVYTSEEPQRGERRFVIRKPGELPIVQLGWRLPEATHEDVVPLKILQLVLSGTLDINEFGDPLDPGINNRLYQGLVETELATSARMSYVLMIDPVVGSITAHVRPGVDHQKVESALRAEAAKLRDQPITEQELQRAKDRARAAFAMSQDGTFGQSMALGYFGLIGDWRFVRDFPERIAEVSAQDVQRVARQWLHEDNLTVGWFVPTPGGEGDGATAGPQRAFGVEGLRDADDAAEAREVARKAAAQGERKLHRRTLPNGLKILVQENPSTATVALSGAILAGSAHEKPDEAGLAGVTASMLERGTRRHSKQEIAERLEAVGASFGFGGGFESVSVSGLFLPQDLERVVDVMAEQLLEPAFPADELRKDINRRVARIRQSEDSTQVRGRRALMQGLYPKDHPLYVRNPDEAISALQSISRRDIERWHRTWYGPDRTILTVVGNVEAEEVFRALEARLGEWKPVGGPRIEATDVPLAEAGRRVLVHVPDKSNVDIFLGHRGNVKRTADEYYPAMVANHILGGGSTGRLFNVVRNELGLTYGIYSSLSAGAVPGPWSISLTVNPSAVDQSLEAVRGVLSRWTEQGVTRDELEHAQSSLAGLYKVGLATNGALARTLTSFEVLGMGAEFVDEHARRIEALSLEEVNAAIRRHFAPDRMLTVISGSVAPSESGEEPPVPPSAPGKAPPRR